MFSSRLQKSAVLSVLIKIMAGYAAEVYSASCLRDLSAEHPVRRLLEYRRTLRTARFSPHVAEHDRLPFMLAVAVLHFAIDSLPGEDFLPL